MIKHNEFLTSQSNRIREFYSFMVKQYPYLAFTFKGRIKSIIRAEEKFNRYIVDYIYEYYKQYGRYPEVPAIKEKLGCFRDLIAYRIVISMPKCHLRNGENREEEEAEILYEIANAKPSKSGYQSLHLTLYDTMARCYIEVQLRTKSMDDYAEIGPANHLGYEKNQEIEVAKRNEIPVGECKYFDEAYERVILLEQLDLSELDVNMFAAMDNSLINDGCGLFRGRQILPFEHLSRFQND